MNAKYIKPIICNDIDNHTSFELDVVSGVHPQPKTLKTILAFIKYTQTSLT